MNWIIPLIDDYHKWLKNKTITTWDNQTGWAAISTPFIGLFNDVIEIYVQKKTDTTFLLSDGGDTLQNLELVGVNINASSNRKNILNQILINYGVTLMNDNELVTETDLKSFPSKKHNFLSAIMEINDLYVLAKNNVNSIFKEEVEQYLAEENLIYTNDFICKGTTGLEFAFDFQIAAKSTELVIKTFNRMDKSNLTNFLFSWEDIKSVRQKSTKKQVLALAIINDSNKVNETHIEALNSKKATSFLWSNKENLVEKKKLFIN